MRYFIYHWHNEDAYNMLKRNTIGGKQA